MLLFSFFLFLLDSDFFSSNEPENSIKSIPNHATLLYVTFALKPRFQDKDLEPKVSKVQACLLEHYICFILVLTSPDISINLSNKTHLKISILSVSIFRTYSD